MDAIKKTNPWAVFLLCLLQILGLSAASAYAAQQNPANTVPSDALAIRAVNKLAVDLHKLLAEDGENLCFSPYSVSSAFAMTYAGAAGKTARQMEKSLAYGADIHGAFYALGEKLTSLPDGVGELDIANSIWPQAEYRFLNSLRSLLRQSYNAEITALDYAKHSENARKTINDWVAERTKNKIRDILPPNSIDTFTRLVLVNAIYFKSPWLTSFQEGLTRELDFYRTPEKKKMVPMMRATHSFAYLETEEAQAVKIPYRGGMFSMTLILPKTRGGLAVLESHLDEANLRRYEERYERCRVELYMPKFKIESSFQLADAMRELGVSDAFEASTADFSGMNGKRDLFISAALHKAFIEVDEEGTEAAAATAVGMARTSAPLIEDDPVIFRADHPFLYIIQDDLSGAILFMGRVANP